MSNAGAVKRVFSMVGRVLFTLIMVAATVFMLAVLHSKYIKRERVPSVFGYAVLRVETPSMTGEIEVGDAVLVKKTQKVAVGEVAVYTPVGKTYTVTHRVASITSEGNYIMKGDANEDADEGEVSPDRMIGKVVNVWPNLGAFFAWVQNYGAIMIALFFAACACGVWAISAWRTKEK